MGRTAFAFRPSFPCHHRGEARVLEFLREHFAAERVRPSVRFRWCRSPRTRQTLEFDAVLDRPRIAIEVDGPGHFKFVPGWLPHELRRSRDLYKTCRLLEEGYSIVRIAESDVCGNAGFPWGKLLSEAIRERRDAAFIASDERYERHARDLASEMEAWGGARAWRDGAIRYVDLD